MKITREKLKRIIREALIEERVGGGDAFDEPLLAHLNPLVKSIANELANRAADMQILDDIHDSGNSADEIFYELPKRLVLQLPDGSDGSDLVRKISMGELDETIRELAYPEEAMDEGSSFDDDPDLNDDGYLSVAELVSMVQNMADDAG